MISHNKSSKGGDSFIDGRKQSVKSNRHAVTKKQKPDERKK